MPPKREAAIGSREFINPAKFRALLLHPRCVALRELFDLFELWFPLMEETVAAEDSGRSQDAGMCWVLLVPFGKACEDRSTG